MSDDEVGYRRESHHSPRDRDRRSRDHDRDRRDRDRSSYDDRRSSRDRGSGEDRERSSYSKRDRHHSDRQDDNESTKDTESNDNSYGTDDSYYRRPRYSNNNNSSSSSGNNAGKGRWNDSIPNNIILVRGLPDEADENDIINEFARSGVAVKDVRLMRGKDTGLSRRYCFVEFHTVAESQYWMEVHQGVMKLQDKFTLNMYYSTSRRGNINTITVPDASSIIDSSMDWICAKCSCKNFQRRSHCRRCNNSREESERVTSGDGLDQVGCNPCNTLILRGLDGLTTEENIINALSNVTTLPLKNVRVIRDFMTGASNGFAFVEMNSLKESKELLEYLETLENPLEVDGKALLIAYAKNTFSTALATMEMQQHNQTQYMQQQAAVVSAGGVAGVGVVGGYADYSQHGYYDVNAYYYQTTALPDPSSATQMDSTNAAAAVAQAAIMQSQQKKQSNTTTMTTTMAVVAAAPVLNRSSQLITSPTASTATASQDYPKYPVPDVSTYQYEETSGYYYDPSTGLYYDASTQYYYNSQSQQWLYWDGEHQTYLPAPSTDGTSSAVQQQMSDEQRRGEDDDEKKKRPQSPEKKVKIAKRIVKDMEKWAKRLNAQKDAMKDDMKKMMQTTTMTMTSQASGEPAAVPLYMESASADAGFSLLEKSVYSNKLQPEMGKLRGEMLQQSPASSAAAAGSIPSPLRTKVDLPGPSSSLSSSSFAVDAQKSMFASEEEMTDWKKMACLLCRRAFPSKDVLIKHQQMSDLHKKNLEELYRSKGHVTDESLVQQYRDRAKERREKYGLPEPPQPKKRAREEVAEAVIPFEQPTQEGIKDDNIGNKLLQKMGWKDGQGLGRTNQGIVDPIEARQRQAQAGLGARGSAYNVDTTSGSYKERARKTFMAYFHEIN